MKKNSFAKLAILSVLMLAMIFVGCPQPTGGTPNNNSGTNNGGGNSGSGTSTTLTTAQVTAFQKSITEAKVGSTVKLSKGVVPANSSITINKALTVDGNGVEGLTINVSSSVKNDVTLKGFKKAKIQITTSNNSSRAVSIVDVETQDEDGNIQKIEKFGDGALPLKLEGCEIAEFVAEVPVALYMGTGDEKTSIEELLLKEGAESFTFIENDEGVDSGDKSSIGKFSVEDGKLEEINLIGGTFDTFDFADNFAPKDAIVFNYDKEFEQFKDDAFFDMTFIDEKDIALAENEFATGESGVYKFEMSKAAFEKLNKYMSVIFLTDEQVTAIKNTNDPISLSYWKKMKFDSPVYDMSVMGLFTVDSKASGYSVIHGNADHYMDWSNAWFGNSYGWVKTVYLENYMNYSKDAVVLNVASDKVTLYVNTAAIRKSDLMIRVCPEDFDAEAPDAAPDGLSEGGTKLTAINLTGYKPYFVIGTEHITADFENEESRTAIYNALQTALGNSLLGEVAQGITFMPPCSSEQKEIALENYIPYAMTSVDKYPAEAASLTEETIAIDKQETVTVNYYDWDLKTAIDSAKVIKGNVAPLSDPYEYYLDKDFEKMLPSVGSGTDNINWEMLPEAAQKATTLYARPKRYFAFFGADLFSLNADNSQESDEPQLMYYAQLANIDFISEEYLTFNTLPVVVFAEYDYEKKEYKNQITSPKEIPEGAMLYLTEPKAKRYLVDQDDSTAAPLDMGDCPVTDVVNVLGDYYSAADLKTKCTQDDFKKMYTKLLTPVYYKVEMNIYGEDGQTVEETISYGTLKKRIEAGTKYYEMFSLEGVHDENGNEITLTEADVTITTESLAKKVKTGWVSWPGSTFQIYSQMESKDKITIVENGYESEIKLSQVLQELSGGYYIFYNDQNKTKALTAAEIKALVGTANAKVYKEAKKLSIVTVNESGEADTANANAMELMMIVQEVEFMGSKYYKEAACTTAYTADELKALAAGSTIYWKMEQPQA